MNFKAIPRKNPKTPTQTSFRHTSYKPQIASKIKVINQTKEALQNLENIPLSLEKLERKEVMAEKTENIVTLTIESSINKEIQTNKSRSNSLNETSNKLLMTSNSNMNEILITYDDQRAEIKSNISIPFERNRTKTIENRPNPLNERTSMPNIQSDSRSSIPSHKMNKNTIKPFSDIGLDGRFSFKKSTELIKKSNFKLNNKALKPVLKNNDSKTIDMVNEDISLIENSNSNTNIEDKNIKSSKTVETNAKNPEIIKKVPRLNIPQTKYYHQHITKIINSDKSFNNFQSFNKEKTPRKNYIKENLKLNSARTAKSQSKPTHITNRARVSIPNFTLTFEKLANKPKIIKNSENIRKLYTELLRKLELMRFSINPLELKTEDKILKKKTQSIIGLEAVKLESSINDFEVFEVVCAKYGKEYYCLLNRIFNLYAIYKKDSLFINLRQFTRFLKDFFPEWLEKQFFSNMIEIVYKRVVKNQDLCDLKAFIELLYEVNKLKKLKNLSKPFKNKENSEKITPVLTKDQTFKLFLDESLVPIYIILLNRGKGQLFDRIQVFFEPYEENDNPIINLFIEKDNLIKHIFSVYEILDIKFSNQSFIDLKGFLRFSGEYSIIPTVVNSCQIRKIFMGYKKYEYDIVDYPCFVILLCCIAHIGLDKEKNQGFYVKIKKLLEFLQRNNEKISEKLILKELLK